MLNYSRDWEGLMRDGYRIIDTDTHVGPTADVLYEYGSEQLTARREELAPYERQFRDGIGLSINPYPYKRKMGEKADAGEADAQRLRAAQTRASSARWY